MKKIFIITFLTIFTFSCESPAPAEMEAERAPGFLRTSDGDIPADDANPENLDLWDKYIEAHSVSPSRDINDDKMIKNLKKVCFVEGGLTRQETVFNCLKFIPVSCKIFNLDSEFDAKIIG